MGRFLNLHTALARHLEYILKYIFSRGHFLGKSMAVQENKSNTIRFLIEEIIIIF